MINTIINGKVTACHKTLQVSSTEMHQTLWWNSLVPDLRFIRSLNLHAGAFLESLVTFVRAGVGLLHVTIAHINWYYIIILYVSYFSQSFQEMLKFGFNDFSECLGQLDEPIWLGSSLSNWMMSASEITWNHSFIIYKSSIFQLITHINIARSTSLNFI